MTRVVSLPDVVPPPRFDGVPWSLVLVQEAGAPSAVWAQIDSQVLTVVDVDPAAPAARSVTTANAELTTGWYRLQFVDGSAGVSEPSELVRSSIDSSLPPSPSDVREGSPLLRARFPQPATDPSQTGDLRRMTYQATADVQALTWRTIDQTLGCPAPEGYSCQGVPDELADIAVQAITRMVERIYVTTQPQFAEQIATGRRLRGFSASVYSEQYFAPGEFARRGAVQSRPTVDQDDALDQALWALMTEDARDYFVWRATGIAPPTGVATGFDYRRLSVGYGAGSAAGFGGGFGHGGPDGF